MLSFFPLDVLDEIWDLIGSVSDAFPTFFPHITLIPVAHNVKCKTVPRYMYPTLAHKVPHNVRGLHGISCTNKIEHGLTACTIHSRKLGGYLFDHANKPSSISYIILYQCQSIESMLIQCCLNIVCPIEMFQDLMCI